MRAELTFHPFPQVSPPGGKELLLITSSKVFRKGDLYGGRQWRIEGDPGWNGKEYVYALKNLSDVIFWAELPDAVALANSAHGMKAAAPAQPRQHQWDATGERCTVCGDKDWMGGPCSGPPSGQAQPRRSTLDERLDRAAAKVATWPPEKLAGMQLQGEDAHGVACGTPRPALRAAVDGVPPLHNAQLHGNHDGLATDRDSAAGRILPGVGGRRGPHDDADRGEVEQPGDCGDCERSVARPAPGGAGDGACAAAGLPSGGDRVLHRSEPLDATAAPTSDVSSTAPAFQHCEECTGWYARCRETSQCQRPHGVRALHDTQCATCSGNGQNPAWPLAVCQSCDGTGRAAGPHGVEEVPRG